MVIEGGRNWSSERSISTCTPIPSNQSFVPAQFGDGKWDEESVGGSQVTTAAEESPWLAERADGPKRLRRDVSCAAPRSSPKRFSTMMVDPGHLPDLIDGPAADLPLLSPSTIMGGSWDDSKVLDSVTAMPTEMLQGSDEMESQISRIERGEEGGVLPDQKLDKDSDSCQVGLDSRMNFDTTIEPSKEASTQSGLLESWSSVGNLLDISVELMRSNNGNSFEAMPTNRLQWTSPALSSSPQASTTQSCVLSGRQSPTPDIGLQVNMDAKVDLNSLSLEQKNTRHVEHGFAEGSSSPQIQSVFMQHEQQQHLSHLHRRNTSIASSDTKDSTVSSTANPNSETELLSKESVNYQKKQHQVMSGNLTREFKEAILRQIQRSYTHRASDKSSNPQGLQPMQQLSLPSVLASPLDTSPSSVSSSGIQPFQQPYSNNGDFFTNNNPSHMAQLLQTSAQPMLGLQQSSSIAVNYPNHNRPVPTIGDPLSQSAEGQQQQLHHQESQRMSSHAQMATINHEEKVNGLENQQQMQIRLDMKRAFEHQQQLLMSHAAAAVADHQAAQNQLQRQQQPFSQGLPMTQPAKSLSTSGFSVGSRMTPQDVEAMVMRQFQDKVLQLDIGTRMRLQDSLYRLARSAQERQEGRGFAQNSGHLDYLELDSCLTGERTLQKSRSLMETPTNPVDRNVVNMLYSPLCLPGQKYAPQHRPLSEARARDGNGQWAWSSAGLRSNDWGAAPVPDTPPDSHCLGAVTQNTPDSSLMTWATAPLLNDHRSPTGASSTLIDHCRLDGVNITSMAPNDTTMQGLGCTTQPLDIQAARRCHSPSSSLRSESYSSGGQFFGYGNRFNGASSYESHDGSLMSGGQGESINGVENFSNQTFAMMNMDDDILGAAQSIQNRSAADNDMFQLSGNSNITGFSQEYQGYQGGSHVRLNTCVGGMEQTADRSYFDQIGSNRFGGLMNTMAHSFNQAT